jgi:alkyldihydroxyacetonephosphate synthase
MTPKAPPPQWYEGPVPSDSFRSFFKWGQHDTYKHPNAGLVKLIKDWMGFTDQELINPSSLGLEKIPQEIPFRRLTEQNVEELTALIGSKNISNRPGTRLKAGYGQSYYDAVRLREGLIENIPDVVLFPRTEEDIQKILSYCNQHKIPIYVVSGRSSVTRGVEAVQGGISLDMTAHMNKILQFNETNHTITVQPGIYGPALEEALNNSQQIFGAKFAYTCGHFPQSFEFSTVGGWVATRGAGQNSTYYGKIEDLVVAQKYLTPQGIIQTANYPRQATGPDIDQIMVGSEGVLGILVAVTLKVFRHMPENRKYFSFLFKNWESTYQAAREIMQSENGFPSVFRISDPEETEIAMHLYKVAGSPAEKMLEMLRFATNKKCLMLGWTEGGKHLSQAAYKNILRICKSHQTIPLNSFKVTQRWEHSRFLDPYMRDDLSDFGITIDTLECSVTWETLEKVHTGVRNVIKQRTNTVCMTHMSHVYPQGGNLYFIFLTRYKNRQDYLDLQYSILDAIQRNGASMSHHHGVGKQLAPWLENQIGKDQMALLKSIKNHFDPNCILNPGGTLGLDMSPEQASKRWGV